MKGTLRVATVLEAVAKTIPMVKDKIDSENLDSIFSEIESKLRSLMVDTYSRIGGDATAQIICDACKKYDLTIDQASVVCNFFVSNITPSVEIDYVLDTVRKAHEKAVANVEDKETKSKAHAFFDLIEMRVKSLTLYTKNIDPPTLAKIVSTSADEVGMKSASKPESKFMTEFLGGLVP